MKAKADLEDPDTDWNEGYISILRKKPYSLALEEYSNALADTLVKILIFNKCRPVEFRNMSRKEVENAKEGKSLSGNKYMVINPAFHKTSRAGTQ